jgi:hypothetical protein
MSPFSTWANYPHHKLGEHIENLMGTHWGNIENQGKMKKKSFPSNLKGK